MKRRQASHPLYNLAKDANDLIETNDHG